MIIFGGFFALPMFESVQEHDQERLKLLNWFYKSFPIGALIFVGWLVLFASVSLRKADIGIGNLLWITVLVYFAYLHRPFSRRDQEQKAPVVWAYNGLLIGVLVSIWLRAGLIWLHALS
jgi:hypothetical protein